MAEKDLKEKLKTLEKQIAEAEAEGNETYLNYLFRVRELTINVYQGGQVFINTGSPPPLPPY